MLLAFSQPPSTVTEGGAITDKKKSQNEKKRKTLKAIRTI